MAAAVQHRGLAAHAQHAQGEEGLHLHVSLQRQQFEKKMQLQVSYLVLRHVTVDRKLLFLQMLFIHQHVEFHCNFYHNRTE